MGLQEPFLQMSRANIVPFIISFLFSFAVNSAPDSLKAGRVTCNDNGGKDRLKYLLNRSSGARNTAWRKHF